MLILFLFAYFLKRVTHESPMQFRNTRCFMGGELRQNEYALAVVGSERVKGIVNTVNK